MGILDSSKKTHSSSWVDLKGAFGPEKDLTNQQVALGFQQLEALSRLGKFDANMFYRALPQMVSQANKFLGTEDKITAQSLGFSKNIIGAQNSLMNDALAQIDQGVSLSPDQEALIKSSADNAIKSGLSDIGAFRDESLRSLAQETSQARGLRPEDTPILDVGGRIAIDANRNASQLIDQVRANEAQQRLEYPIQAGQYKAGLITNQQQLGTTNQAFINQLRQDAFSNRLNLLATTGNIGVNAASIAPNANVMPTLADIRLRSSTQYSQGKQVGNPGVLGAASAAGGIGGFIEGVNSIGK